MHGLIPAPTDPAELPVWRETLHQWRASTRTLMRYDGSLYNRPEFAWIPRTFTLGFVMMYDALFFDGRFRIDEYLDHGLREFGGYDAIILWHAYPRIGFDQRNQFEFYLAMPGGLGMLRTLVEVCHNRGVRVYIDYNPWDTGTPQPWLEHDEALVSLVSTLDADGIFLDTMSSAAGLRDMLDAERPGATLESEVLVPLEHIDTHPSSWAQSITDVPGVLRNKWFERRHMHHRIRRWQLDHTPELHTAWMNGTGMVVWENVFGTPVLWNERDKSVLRAMVGVQRRYADLFRGEGWTPLVPTLDSRIHASEWTDGAVHLWTLNNTTNEPLDIAAMAIEHREGNRYYDLIHGREVHPSIDGTAATVRLGFGPRGVGALLATSDHTPDLRDFLARQADIDSRASADATPPVVVQTRSLPSVTHTNRSRNIDPALESPPLHANGKGDLEGEDDMVDIPAHSFDMEVTFTVRECGFYDVPGVTPPGLRFANLHREWSFTRPVALAAYAIDPTPVTNAQYAEFLRATGYMPAVEVSFLRHWDGGAIPPGLEDHPVVYVDLEDARAYAAWVGKRLPTEAEWQHAAQGIEGRPWPWGHNWHPEACNHGQFGGTTPVRQFPDGATPDGIFDLCGNVWEWTDEYSDSRTRFAILKGGSYYKAHGSVWYADGGAKPNTFAAKFLLMYPGLDRCATIGFRCAAGRS